MLPRESESLPVCLGCGKPYNELHEPECEYAPWYSTQHGYPPSRVNDLQTRIPPINTREG